MMTFWLILFILLSIVLLMTLIFMVRYIKYLVARLKFIAETKHNFLKAVNDYADNVESTYADMRFYGDPTLEKLVNYSKDVVEMIRHYDQEFYEFLENDLFLEENYDYYYEEEDEKEEER